MEIVCFVVQLQHFKAHRTLIKNSDKCVPMLFKRINLYSKKKSIKECLNNMIHPKRSLNNILNKFKMDKLWEDQLNYRHSLWDQMSNSMLKELVINCQILDCLIIQKKKYNYVESRMINTKMVIICLKKYIKSKEKNEYQLYIQNYMGNNCTGQCAGCYKRDIEILKSEQHQILSEKPYESLSRKSSKNYVQDAIPLGSNYEINIKPITKSVVDIVSDKSKKTKAAIKIQSCWKGYSVRKKQPLMNNTKTSVETEGNKITGTYFERLCNLSKLQKLAKMYNGQWLGKDRHGKGIQTWPDGAIYDGEWQHNTAHGKGLFRHADKIEYEGEWKYSKACGYGIMRSQNGAYYEGEWENDLQHGYGKEQWADSSVYEGQYYQGLKHGKGKYVWKDNSYYEGEWQNNKIHGLGAYHWIDGRGYKGEWKNGMMNGHGEYSWSDGRKYVGEYLNDQKHGYGEYKWVDGKEFRGLWQKGVQHGEGVYVTVDGRTKRGLWQEGKLVQWLK
ncbi:unnamed protein product [Paramecium primaurelia]|uniref:MORN repeat protein n=1 Tax=Paramecium primaurelia TaxID=5886 RepID=A0A8S1NW96_PARPR|nr:unnamed protein product [Paramecium primaurelia]